MPGWALAAKTLHLGWLAAAKQKAGVQPCSLRTSYMAPLRRHKLLSFAQNFSLAHFCRFLRCATRASRAASP